MSEIEVQTSYSLDDEVFNSATLPSSRLSSVKQFLASHKLLTVGGFILSAIGAYKAVPVIAEEYAVSEHPAVGVARDTVPIAQELRDMFDTPEFEVRFYKIEDKGSYNLHKGHMEVEGEKLDLKLYVPNQGAGLPFVSVIRMLENVDYITNKICTGFVDEGYVVASLDRPWPFFKAGLDLEIVQERMIDAVCHQSALIDYAETLERVDPEKINCLGVSMGGILSVMLAGVDDRVQNLMVCIAGGDFETLLLESEESSVRDWMDDLMQRHDLCVEELCTLLKDFIDPLDFAPAIDRDHVLYTHATRDKVIPQDSYAALYRELGRPRKIEVSLGHYQTFIVYNRLTELTVDFFNERMSHQEGSLALKD